MIPRPCGVDGVIMLRCDDFGGGEVKFCILWGVSKETSLSGVEEDMDIACDGVNACRLCEVDMVEDIFAIIDGSKFRIAMSKASMSIL